MSWPGGNGGPISIPPELARQLQEQAKQQAAMAAAMEALEIEQRQLVVFHAWLLCTCRKWFDWEQIDVPPSAGCPVHGHVIMTRDGRAL